MSDAYEEYISRKRGAEAAERVEHMTIAVSDKATLEDIAVEAVAKALGGEVHVVKPKRSFAQRIGLWVVVPLSAILALAGAGAYAWAYSSSYSLYCDKAATILGHEMCDSSTSDGWTRDPTAGEWAKIDSVLQAEHVMGNFGVLLGVGLFGYAIALTGVALRKHGKSLWWLSLIVLGPLAIVVGLIALLALAGLAERGNHKDAWGQPKRVFRPDGLTTSKQQAEWESRFGRGTPQNLWGIYKAGGQLRIDQGKHTYYLGDDEQWHLLGPGPPPYEAWRQGAIS